MRRRPPISTRTDTLFPTRRSSDLSAGSGSRSAHPAAYSHDPAGVAHGGRAGTLRPDRPDDPGHGRNPRGDLGTNRSSIGCPARSEEHTSELQSLMRISYAVFCLQKKTRKKAQPNTSELEEP